MSERNPDSRPLPQGWIAQYDHNYKAWFYVNTLTDPPVSRWEHPAGPPQPPQYLPPPVGPGGYAPQQGNRTPSPGRYNQGAQGQGSQRGYYQGAPPDDLRQGNWQQYPQQGSGWQQYPQWQQGAPVRYDGSYGQDYPQENPPEERRGFFGHHRQQQQQQQPQGASSKSSGFGMLGMAAAGLAGGMVLEDLIDNHDRDDGYDGGDGGDGGFF